MILKPRPISADAFEAYGRLVRAPEETGRRAVDSALQNLRESATPSLSVSTSPPKDLPLVSGEMERHEFSTQTFLPLDVSRYVVVVAPHASAGGPNPTRAQAFVVPGDTGVSYGANVWHHAMIILDRPGQFAVFMWRDGTGGDIDIVSFSEALEIQAP